MSLGFDDRAAWAIAITISELASNAIKFAGSGTLSIQVITQPGPGLEIRVADRGPGLEDVASALRDDFSEGRNLSEVGQPCWPPRGLGAGLGAVERLMDELHVEHPQEGGLTVVAVKYINPAHLPPR